jgi:hypothetical protein
MLKLSPLIKNYERLSQIIMKTHSNRSYFMRHGLYINMVGKEVIAQQTAATCTASFQGKIEDPISLYWKDYYNENDNN